MEFAYGSALLMSMENEKPKSTPIGQSSLFGTMDDDQVIQELITAAIKDSHKSREQIAEEMQTLMGRKFTVRMLNAYTSEANEKHRFPLAFARAFCQAVNDWRVLSYIVVESGFGFATTEDVAFAELGKEFLNRESAAEKIAQLKSKLGRQK